MSQGSRVKLDNGIDQNKSKIEGGHATFDSDIEAIKRKLFQKNRALILTRLKTAKWDTSLLDNPMSGRFSSPIAHIKQNLIRSIKL